MASGRPRPLWAAKARAATAFCLAGTVAGIGLYFANLAYVRAEDQAARAAALERLPAGQVERLPLKAAVAPLVELLPQDIDHPAAQCRAVTPPYRWQMPGLVQALSCTDPGLPGGQVYAFQMNSYASFQMTWQNYNTWWGIDTLKPGSNCPPTSGGAGIVGFHDNFFKSRAGQVLECETVHNGSNTLPAYAWAYPTEDAFIVAQGAPGSSFPVLDAWWRNNSGPLSAPILSGSP
jgi:hypothetical protein